MLVGGMRVGGSAESLAVVTCDMFLSLFRKGKERRKNILFEEEEKIILEPLAPPADRGRSRVTCHSRSILLFLQLPAGSCDM